MNEEQKRHAIRLANTASDLCFDKYERGAAEHSDTKLWELSGSELLDNAINEVADLMNYLLTMRENYIKFLAYEELPKVVDKSRKKPKAKNGQ